MPVRPELSLALGKVLDIVQKSSRERKADYFELLDKDDSAITVDEDGELEEDSEENDNEESVDDSNLLPLTEEEAAVHALLVELFTDRPQSARQGAFYTPLMHYILLSSLRSDGGWCRSSVMTQKIAAILFTGRVTFGRMLMSTTDVEESTFHT
jgi:hypothetical protein